MRCWLCISVQICCGQATRLRVDRDRLWREIAVFLVPVSLAVLVQTVKHIAHPRVSHLVPLRSWMGMVVECMVLLLDGRSAFGRQSVLLQAAVGLGWNSTLDQTGIESRIQVLRPEVLSIR